MKKKKKKKHPIPKLIFSKALITQSTSKVYVQARVFLALFIFKVQFVKFILGKCNAKRICLLEEQTLIFFLLERSLFEFGSAHFSGLEHGT